MTESSRHAAALSDTLPFASVCACPPAPVEALSDETLTQAAQWYAVLRDGQATALEQQQWQGWLAASPEHAKAWQLVQSISGSFAPLRALPNAEMAAAELQAAHARMAQTASRRRVVMAGFAVLATGASGWALWKAEWMPAAVLAWAAEHQTRVGEQRQVVLADGSALWLNTATAVDVDYAAKERRVLLRAGQVMVETGRDALDRPFIVQSPQGTMRALGTRFDVRLRGDATELSVYEGQVQVRTRCGSEVRVAADQRLRFTADALGPVDAADDTQQAWMKGLLVADDMPLMDVVQELQRYRRGQIVLAPELADLKLYGSVPLHDTDAALAMIAKVFHVRVKPIGPSRVAIQSR